MALDKIQVGAVGIDIFFHFVDPSDGTTPIDLTTVDSIQGRLMPPSEQAKIDIGQTGVADTVTVTVSGSATLGVGVYTTTATSDIDEVGIWQAQAIATFDATHIYPSEVVRFDAKVNLAVA